MTESPHLRATESLRSTSKWLITSLTAVGVLTVGGVQVNRLDHLDVADHPLQACAALACLVGAATLLGATIWRTAQVLTERWATISDLSDQSFAELLERPTVTPAGDVLRRAGRVGTELHGAAAPSISALHTRLREVGERTAAEIERAGAGRTHHVPADLETLLVANAEIRSAVNRVVDFANHEAVSRRFSVAVRWIVGGVAGILVLNLAFVLLTRPSAPDPVTPIICVAVTVDDARGAEANATPLATPTEPCRRP